MNVDGNGNDPHSHGKKFPRILYCCRLALCCRLGFVHHCAIPPLVTDNILEDDCRNTMSDFQNGVNGFFRIFTF